MLGEVRSNDAITSEILFEIVYVVEIGSDLCQFGSYKLFQSCIP
jgi:hypothetical protein